MIWHQELSVPPWKPPTNQERRAAWAAKYYLLFKPHMHPRPQPKEERV